MENELWYQKLKRERKHCGLTQAQLGFHVGITRRRISEIEAGTRIVDDNTKELLVSKMNEIYKGYEMELLFDYMRVRFPTLDVKYVITEVLGLRIDHMVHENFGFYHYSYHYKFADIMVLYSDDISKGVLLELKGKGCRLFEGMLKARQKTWYDFFFDCFCERAVFKRVDLAIDDMVGILDIKELTRKCQRGEWISCFRRYKSYTSGQRTEDGDIMGNTLYLGSKRNDVYICIYQKDVEQFVKQGTPIEDQFVKNRFEIRLQNDRAVLAVQELYHTRDIKQVAFSIINQYVRFVDKKKGVTKANWNINPKWQQFIGDVSDRLKLTMKPEPITYERQLM